MIPQIIGGISQQITYVQQPSKTYHDTGYQITGYVDKLEAIQQTITHIINTERYAYAIYSKNYGIELQQYLSRGFDYLSATIQNTLKDALTQDDRITGVLVTDVTQESIDSASVKFTAYTAIGVIERRISIGV